MQIKTRYQNRWSVCLPACLSVSVCYSAFNALCRSRRGTRTDGGPQLWSVCLPACLSVSVCYSEFNALWRSRRDTRTEGGPQLWSVCLLFPFQCLALCRSRHGTRIEGGAKFIALCKLRQHFGFLFLLFSFFLKEAKLMSFTS